MNLEKYECLSDEDYSSFTFLSEGPKGAIKKKVSYQELTTLPDGRPVVNLGFGDWDELRGSIDDAVVSDNKDRDKILATIASTILAYTEKHGKVPVFVQGSTPAKTRLYQMGINAHWKEVGMLFEVYGRLNGVWRKFRSGVNFTAFLAVRK